MGKVWKIFLAGALFSAVAFSVSVFFIRSAEQNIRKAPAAFEIKPFVSVSFGRTTVLAEIASATGRLALGLSGRDELAGDAGMLFVFQPPEKSDIWMKDMKFPIDIIWLDENFIVTDMKKRVGPESYPEIFHPRSKSRFVLEVSAGFAEKNEIKTGDRAKIF